MHIPPFPPSLSSHSDDEKLSCCQSLGLGGSNAHPNHPLAPTQPPDAAGHRDTSGLGFAGLKITS